MQWEYKIVDGSCSIGVPLTGNELNELGLQGWELVFISPDQTDYHFKRKLS